MYGSCWYQNLAEAKKQGLITKPLSLSLNTFKFSLCLQTQSEVLHEENRRRNCLTVSHD